MTVVSAHLEASHFIPSVTTPQIVLLMPVHLWTPTQKHKFPWYPNSISVQLPFIPPMSFFKRCHMHSRAKRCVSLQSHSACPRLLMEGGTSKGWQRKWKGTLFIRHWCETYRRSASALNQPRLLDMLNRRAAEQDRLESGRQGQKQREKQWMILWDWRRNMFKKKKESKKR